MIPIIHTIRFFLLLYCHGEFFLMKSFIYIIVSYTFLYLSFYGRQTLSKKGSVNRNLDSVKQVYQNVGTAISPIVKKFHSV